MADVTGSVPEALLVPLLDAAAEVLRGSEADAVPRSLTDLARMHPRALTASAGRARLRLSFETDEGFRTKVVEGFAAGGGRAVLDDWDDEAPGVAVEEAEARGDLPQLVSALVAFGPDGADYAIGRAVALFEVQRRERAAGADQLALERRVRELTEAAERAERARQDERLRVERLEAELRDERRSRREREERADRAADTERERADALEGEVARAGARSEAADARRARDAERTVRAEGEARELRDRVARLESELAAARRAPVPRPTPAMPTASPMRPEDVDALVAAAEVAERVANDAARLAKGLAGVADEARRRGWALPADEVGAEPLPTEKPRRRTRVLVPPGLVAETPEGVTGMLRQPGLTLVVDGYNASMKGWRELAPAQQRDRLLAGLGDLGRRTGCAVTVVFDGADVGAVQPTRRPGMRVRFSDADEEADDVVVREVEAMEPEIPVLVVSSDQDVRRRSEAHGARVVPSEALLGALRA